MMNFGNELKVHDAIALASPLTCFLPGYEVQMNESGLEHSKQKLLETKTTFEEEFPVSAPCVLQPCENEEETLGYRSSCTFQLVLSEQNLLEYAMRTKGVVQKLNCSYFPIASRRIQITMSALLDALNTSSMNISHHNNQVESHIQNNSRFRFPILCEHLTSVSFTSSWNERECLVTLHYAPPGLPAPSITSAEAAERRKIWMEEANEVRLKCGATILSGRSRRVHLSVPEIEPIDGFAKGDCAVSFRDEINVSILNQQDLLNYHSLPIYYEKPESAFQHPNPRVMYQALNWLCSQMKQILHNEQRPITLLELYCGYGAHTIPLCKSNICKKIIAVEMDDRLANACKRNCVINQCADVVTVVTADAGILSRTMLRRNTSARTGQKEKTCSELSLLRNNPTMDWTTEMTFDILLVDPPRQGLDSNVCELTKLSPSFRHIFYISCGRRALLRDLKLLNKTFDVKEVKMLDLFPRTDSVETLVHLQRKL